MKPLKTFGGLILSASTLFLVTSCSKSVDEQFAKGDNEVGKFAPAACEPFVGFQTKKNNMPATYVFYGNHMAPGETQAFYGSDFSATNLLTITATGGTPYHNADWNFIGVTDQWIDANESLSIKLSGSLATRAINRMSLQARAKDLVGTADFYLAGIMVGTMALSSGPVQEIQTLMYDAVGPNADFDEVRLSVTAGRLAITGYTPNSQNTGYSGFYLVEAPGRAVVGRFVLGSTVIAGDARVNQYFTFENSYNNPVPAIERQNKLPGSSGEFPTGQWAGAKHWVNIWGEDAGLPAPLGFGTYVPAQMRLGVNNALITGTETITITPGADFPDGGSSAKLRAVQVRQASISGSTMLVKVWSGMTLVASAISSGADASYVLIAPGVNFDRVTIEAMSGADLSVGRIDPGPYSANVKLYPACP